MKRSFFEFDPFREIARMSVSNVASSLSSFIGGKIAISQYKSKPVPLADVPGMVGAPRDIVFAACMEVFGGTPGSFLFVLSETDALAFVGLQSSGKKRKNKNLRRLEKQILKQVATVFAASYLFAVGKITGTRAFPGDPEVFWGKQTLLTNELKATFGSSAQESFFTKTEILVGNVKTGVCTFFLPSPESYDALISLMGAVVRQIEMQNLTQTPIEELLALINTEERRVVPRVFGLDLSVKFKEIESSFDFSRGICGNISAGGMLLLSDQDLAPGSRLFVNIDSPEENLDLDLAGRIVWKNAAFDKKKYGINFEDMTQGDKNSLEEFVSTRIIYVS